MATTRNVDLYLNLSRPADGVLLAGRADLTSAEPPVFIDGEKPTLRLQLLLPSIPGVAPEVTQLDAGDVIIFSLKKKTGGSLLVLGSGFALQGTGNDRYYVAAVDFNTNQLVNAFGDETVLATLLEIRLQNAANTSRKIFQARCTVKRRVYDADASPESIQPAYPVAESILTTAPDSAAIKRGTINLNAAAYEGVAVAFATAFATAPTQVRAWVLKKAGAAAVMAFENHDSVTAEGFSVDLSAAIPGNALAGDYKLAWCAIL